MDAIVDLSQARRLVTQLRGRVAELQAELDECDALRTRLSELLTGVAAGLKGPPPPLTLHDWSDLPVKAMHTATERDHYQQVVIDMGEKMTAAVNALRGKPPKDVDWSTHDVAELAAKAAAVANAAVNLEVLPDAFWRALDAWIALQDETARDYAELEARAAAWRAEQERDA
jgi:hypothetical protein